MTESTMTCLVLIYTENLTNQLVLATSEKNVAFICKYNKKQTDNITNMRHLHHIFSLSL